ncbi:MAG: DUF4292 domain-containing protein [candidate division KSB1 bacterium]|nr:DUF4292 domain-containing protein [candidate division KSB1 bacterium]
MARARLQAAGGIGLLLGPILFFLLTGCAGRAPRVHDEWQPRELYLRVAENYRRLQTFHGDGRLTIESPQFQFSAPARILAVKPDSLFIKVEAGLGVDVGFFFADRKRFASFSPLENVYYHGETEKMRELMFFRMELTYDEMLSGLLGAALPPFDSSFTITRDGNDYRFEGKRRQRLYGIESSLVNGSGLTQYAAADAENDGEWRLTYWVNAERGVVTRAEQRDPMNVLSARQEFKRFRQVRGVWLPQLIQIQRFEEQERLTIFYNRIEANARIAPAEFAIRVPKNARRVNLSDPEALQKVRESMKEEQ